MAKSTTGDEFEVIGYFIGFWLFIFSSSFRETWINEFKKGNWLGKFVDIIEAVSIIIGVILPAVAIKFIWFN